MAADADATDADGAGSYIPEPQLSQHALGRWDERLPDGAVAPETALLEAIPDDGIVEHPRFGDASKDGHPDPDRVWIQTGKADGEWYTAVFVECDGAVVTVWRGDREVRYPHIAAYLVMRGLGALAGDLFEVFDKP